jgi:hypothetical protein
MTGFGLVMGFTERFHVVTASNYTVITNSHPQHFTIAHTKYFEYVFLIMDPKYTFCLSPYWQINWSLESYVTTDGQSASLSWNKAPIWGLPLDFYYCQTVAALLMWIALSDERTGLSFTMAAGPRQDSHSRVRFQLDSRPYFTFSDLRLPFSSPPTTRRVTVEVFDPSSTRE